MHTEHGPAELLIIWVYVRVQYQHYLGKVAEIVHEVMLHIGTVSDDIQATDTFEVNPTTMPSDPTRMQWYY